MLAHNLPVGFGVQFSETTVEVPPGASNFRELSLIVTPQPGMPTGDVAFQVTGTSTTEADIRDAAGAAVSVVAIGVDVQMTPTSGSPGGTFNLMVTNTGQVADTLRLDHVTVAGKTRIRTGRGRVLVELVDTVLTGKSNIFTGRGDDTLRVHDSQFLSDILFDGYLGTDILDAGTSRRPNSNGNLFARSPRVAFETPLS